MTPSAFRTIAVCIVLTAATQASALPPQASSNAQPVRPSDAIPAAGTSAVAISASQGRPVDPDQGDEHASPTAVDKVCNSDTPAAERSAICDGFISRG
jgi:hypothetical protein